MEALFSRRIALLGALGIAGTAVAGCAGQAPALPLGSSSAPGTTVPATGPAATPTPTVDSVPRWPLNGRPLRDPAAARHAAVAVKVPDNHNEHPQSGLDKADIVFVELDGYRDSTGYSGTRLVPVFHSQMPEGVNPVRSIRPVDIPLLSPINAIIGNTGATPWVINYAKHYHQYLEGMKSYMATKGTGAYGIDPRRVRVWQGVTYYDRAVVCHPAILAKVANRFQAGPPQVYFPYAATSAAVSTASGKGARTISVPWKNADTYNMGYRYDEKSGTYLRSMPWGPHVLANGKRVAPTNVLVIQAHQHYAKIYSGGGHSEPIHDIINTGGRFLYAHGGAYVSGTWAKGEVNTLFTFTLDDGSPLQMAPGQTFVELARTSAKVHVKG